MDKRKLITELETYLREEMREAEAKADAGRKAEIERQLTMYRFLPCRQYGPEDSIVPSTLVELSLGGTRAFYFIVPQGGGLVTRVDGRAVQVITPNSPLGEALLGKKAGDRVRIDGISGPREYEILTVS